MHPFRAFFKIKKKKFFCHFSMASALKRVNSSFSLDRIEKLLHLKFLSLEDKLNIIEIKIKNTGISSDFLNYGIEFDKHTIRISPVVNNYLMQTTQLDVIGMHMNPEEGFLRFCIPKQTYTNYIILELVTENGDLVIFKGYPVIRRSNPYGCFLFYVLEIVNKDKKEIINKMAKHSNIDLSSFNILSKSKKIPGRCKLNPEVINLHSDDVVVVHKKLEYFLDRDKDSNILLFKRFFLDNKDDNNLSDTVISKYTEWLFEYNKHKSFEVEINQKTFMMVCLFLSATLSILNDVMKNLNIDYLLINIFLSLLDFLSRSSTYIFAYLGTKILLYQLALKYEHDTYKEQFERLTILTEGLSFKDTEVLLQSVYSNIKKAEYLKSSQSLKPNDRSLLSRYYMYIASFFTNATKSARHQLLYSLSTGVYPSPELIKLAFTQQLHINFDNLYKLPIFDVVGDTSYALIDHFDHVELKFSNGSGRIPIDVLKLTTKYSTCVQTCYYKPLPCKPLFSNLIHLLCFIDQKKYHLTDAYIIKSSQSSPRFNVQNIENDIFESLQQGSFANITKYLSLIEPFQSK